MAEIVLGVTGGVAAYKAIDVVRHLRRQDHGVSVVMTKASTRFVGPASFAALSGRPVVTDTFAGAREGRYLHLDLARLAQAMVVAPASANTIARMAAGMASDALGSVYLAFEGPVLVAPAMNTRMLAHPATEANLATLQARGVQLIPPGTGTLADGDVGAGRLAEPGDIVAAVEACLVEAGALAGRRVVVSAGGTREPLDAVRFLGNRSSGRMGFAIAEAAARRGAKVTVLAANVDLPRHPAIRYLDAATAVELHRLALAELPDADLVVMAAAVADYRPAAPRAGKLAKEEAESLELRLERTDDVLADLAARRQRQVLVGFAAEHGPGALERARAKRARKGVDVLVLNDVSRPGVGFESSENAVTILGPRDREEELPRMSKAACAERILDAVAPLLERSTAP